MIVARRGTAARVCKTCVTLLVGSQPLSPVLYCIRISTRDLFRTYRFVSCLEDDGPAALCDWAGWGVP